MELSEIVAYARGDQPVDLVLKNVRVANVFIGQIEETEIAIVGGIVVGVGPGYTGKQEIDLGGRYAAPGLIDSHVHIESAMVPPPQFARAVLPRGTTTVVTDPHEIGNVLGIKGIRYMIESARGLPLTMYVNASSCVPSSHMETAGANLAWEDLAPLLEEDSVLGLAEVMNFPGVVYGDPGVLAKVAGFTGRVIDGHCPGLSGQALNAYVAAGIMSDHECTTIEEASEKLARGMYIFIREATNARNLRPLLPVVTPENARRICFCTDDRQPSDLFEEGHIDFMIRTAIAEGLDPITAIRMATLNPAEYFRLHDRGAIAPGRRADLFVFSDLNAPTAEMVFCAGQLAAQDGKYLGAVAPESGEGVRDTVNVNWDKVSFAIPVQGEQVRIIETIPGQLLTNQLVEAAPQADGMVVADTGRDILKFGVIERHTGNSQVGLGLVRGVGLQRGAIASSVAHDHHNIVVIGVDDESMLAAAKAVAETGGGMAVAVGGEVLAQLPLPIAGLMSDQPIEIVRDQMDALLAAARELGSSLHDPFMAMSFMALPVIPSLKITDHGLVDVDKFELTELFV